MNSQTIARVVLTRDGNIHIAYLNRQTYFCTAASLMCLLSDPYRFLEKARRNLTISTYLVNVQQKPIDEIRGLTLLSVYSDKRIVCDFPEVFQLLTIPAIDDTTDSNNCLRIDADFLTGGDFDTKKAFLLLFLSNTQSNTLGSEQVKRNFEISEDTLYKIVGEIFDASVQEPSKERLPNNEHATEEDSLSVTDERSDDTDGNEICENEAANSEPFVPTPKEYPSTIVSIQEYAKHHKIAKSTVSSWVQRGKLSTAFQDENKKWFVDINDTVTDGRAGRKVAPKADVSGRKVIRLKGTDYESVQLYIRERNLVSDHIRPFIRTGEEVWFYEKRNYHEVAWECRNALIIDVNPDYRNKKARETNRERMLRGDPPFVPGTESEMFQLHHIGQKPESPFAIIPQAEHNQKGTNLFLHPGKACTADLHGPEFDKQKRIFWMTYIKYYDEYGTFKKIPYLNPKRKRKEANS